MSPHPGIVGEARGRLVLGLFALFVLVSLLTRWLSLVVEVLDMDEAVAERYERIDEVSRVRVHRQRGCAAR